MQRFSDAFAFPVPRGGELAAWLTTLAMAAIVIGATLTLVAASYVPGDDFQVTVGR
jgi:hypothetical protein